MAAMIQKLFRSSRPLPFKRAKGKQSRIRPVDSVIGPNFWPQSLEKEHKYLTAEQTENVL